MTEYTRYLFGAVSAASRAHADAVADAAGYGLGTFGSPVSGDGLEPATYWVFCTLARPAEVARIRAGMPPSVTLTDAACTDWPVPGAYFSAQLAAHGLVLIQPEI